MTDFTIIGLESLGFLITADSLPMKQVGRSQRFACLAPRIEIRSVDRSRPNPHSITLCSMGSSGGISPFVSQDIDSYIAVADGVGFEPTRGLHPCRFSRPVPSTARPPIPLGASDYLGIGTEPERATRGRVKSGAGSFCYGIAAERRFKRRSAPRHTV
jgi:hypothetical protein